MGTIYRRRNTWYLDIRVKGRRVRKRVGSSKKIAELALKDAEVKVARDEFGFSKDDLAMLINLLFLTGPSLGLPDCE